MSATVNSIPASQIVNVTPNVLSAGGTALDLNGLFLTTSTRVPVGTVVSFPTASAASDYFGPTSAEYDAAVVYFGGFENSNRKPGAILFSQYNADDVGAYLRGGDISALTLTELQALTGVLVVTIDGSVETSSSIDLSGATSFSSAAQIITEALGTIGPTQAVVTGYTGASGTGAISGTTLTIASLTAGQYRVGQVISGSGVTVGTVITALGSGTGGTGTYTVSPSQTAAGPVAITGTDTRLVVTGVTSGTLAVGQEITGSGITPGTFITALVSGTGGTGTYTVSDAQQFASTTISAVQPTVTYDSQSGAFLVVSGTVGDASTISFGSGSIAASLLLTQATGAVTSQGADATTPTAHMNAVVAITQDWATFGNITNPDDSGFANRLEFAQWTSGTNKRYAYICIDSDASPTATVPATGSLGYAIQQAGYNGTLLLYEPADQTPMWDNAFAMGFPASLDFEETNGRATLAFKRQGGLSAAVTNATVATNLQANGYGFYGAYATANDRFLFMYPGAISGDFRWFDTYVNEIWMTNAFQLALMVLLTEAKSIPYNNDGYALIQASCQDVIDQALNFGAIRGGVPLSNAQAAQVNAAAGLKISDTLSTRGWYLQVLPASAQVRAARASPPCTFWYTDGGSIQKIDLTSVTIL